jgi:hypothetical protein
MNHKVISVFLVALAMVACVTQSQGSSLSVASQETIPYPHAGDPYDISSVGNLDWVVACYSEKADSTAIVTQAPDNWTLLETTPVVGSYDPNSGYPQFAWTDGFGGASAGAVSGIYTSDGTGTNNVGAHIAVPAGSGQITVWWVYAIAGSDPSFMVTFDDATTVTAVGTPDFMKTVVNYSTDTAQTLAFNMNVNAGFHAMAVSSVPEPSTLVLFGFGLIGLTVAAWRKRK